MLDNIKADNVLFLDIETVPAFPDFQSLTPAFQKLWTKKADNLKVLAENKTAADKDIYYRAGIYAEFGKIICISVGFVTTKNGEKSLRLKSYYSDDEKQVLQEFSKMLTKYSSSNPYLILCAHNGKEFDFPYISRRMIINGLKLPKLLDLAGKKPWEIPHIDTMELWKFGDYKSYTSLNLLTEILNIPSPKDDIEGSDVARVYWEEKDLERIKTYCQKDVLAIAQLFMRFKGDNLIDSENIEIA